MEALELGVVSNEALADLNPERCYPDGSAGHRERVRHRERDEAPEYHMAKEGER
jgi:hypothetical protein